MTKNDNNSTSNIKTIGFIDGLYGKSQSPTGNYKINLGRYIFANTVVRPIVFTFYVSLLTMAKFICDTIFFIIVEFIYDITPYLPRDKDGRNILDLELLSFKGSSGLSIDYRGENKIKFSVVHRYSNNKELIKNHGKGFKKQLCYFLNFCMGVVSFLAIIPSTVLSGILAFINFIFQIPDTPYIINEKKLVNIIDDKGNDDLKNIDIFYKGNFIAGFMARREKDESLRKLDLDDPQNKDLIKKWVINGYRHHQSQNKGHYIDKEEIMQTLLSENRSWAPLDSSNFISNSQENTKQLEEAGNPYIGSRESQETTHGPKKTC